MTVENSGKPKRKLPEREDALSVPLDFDAAIKAALETRPPPYLKTKERPKRKKRASS